MKQIILYAVMLALCSNLYSQNTIKKVLSEIEKNNTTLTAIRKNIDAEKTHNKTGLLPQNPEVEFNYLWGDPSVIGNRTDFSISQSFDFPTAYSYKNQISDLKNGQAELEYQKHRMEIVRQARLVCIELTYQNALKTELRKRLHNANQLDYAYKSKFNLGELGILEYNKVKLNLLNISKELETSEIDRKALLSELARLNGGMTIGFSDSIFEPQNIPADFDQWYALAEQSNPVLQWIRQEVEISQKQVQLSSAMSLPKFSAGYMSETVIGQQFQGVTAGISIPLWENRNTVKYAKDRTHALQSMETDIKLQVYSEMKASHSRAIELQSSVTDYRDKLLAFSSAGLLEKALDKGEISLAEYLYEVSLFYESSKRLLDLELRQQKAYAELYRYWNEE